MKNLFYCFVTIIAIGYPSFSQENNPYNQAGDTFIKLYKTVLSDYEEGKIKDVNQEMLDSYSKKFGFDRPISLQDFATLTGKIKNTNFEDAINQSGLSNDSKEILKHSTDGNLENLVDLTIKSDISNSEKEIVLSNLAIFNSVNNNPQLFPVTTNKCWICWVGVGAVTGGAICGPACAFVGGIVGAVFGGHEKDTEKEK